MHSFIDFESKWCNVLWIKSTMEWLNDWSFICQIRQQSFNKFKVRGPAGWKVSFLPPSPLLPPVWRQIVKGTPTDGWKSNKMYPLHSRLGINRAWNFRTKLFMNLDKSRPLIYRRPKNNLLALNNFQVNIFCHECALYTSALYTRNFLELFFSWKWIFCPCFFNDFSFFKSSLSQFSKQYMSLGVLELQQIA